MSVNEESKEYSIPWNMRRSFQVDGTHPTYKAGLMKRLMLFAACGVLLATSAFAQSSGMTQREKEEMARRNAIPGNTNAGGSSTVAPSTATRGASSTTGAAGGGAGGGADGGAGGGGGGR